MTLDLDQLLGKTVCLHRNVQCAGGKGVLRYWKVKLLEIKLGVCLHLVGKNTCNCRLVREGFLVVTHWS